MAEKNDKPKLGIAAIEKRKNPRFLLDLPIEYQKTSSGSTLSGRTGNASVGGLLAYVPEPLAKGQHLQLKLFFSAGSVLNFVQVLAEVVWTSPYGNKGWDYQSGLRFVDVSQDDVERLEMFLKQLSLE
jgi:hypothetical protein